MTRPQAVKTRDKIQGARGEFYGKTNLGEDQWTVVRTVSKRLKLANEKTLEG